MRKFLLLPLLIICLWQTPSFANEAEYKRGLQAYEIGSPQQAFKILTPLAEQGHAKAQLLLGALYYGGKGVLQDYSEAAKWNRLSAEQGVAQAQFHLGLQYNFGDGVTKSKTHAYVWISIAKVNGNIDAKRILKTIERGLTPADLEQAQTLAFRCIDSDYKDCG